jgi:amino acid transporter
MKKTKRILAWIGIVVIAALYATTVILGIFGNANTFRLFLLSIIATFVVPVLIWAYTFIYNLLKKHGEDMNRQ